MSEPGQGEGSDEAGDQAEYLVPKQSTNEPRRLLSGLVRVLRRSREEAQGERSRRTGAAAEAGCAGPARGRPDTHFPRRGPLCAHARASGLSGRVRFGFSSCSRGLCSLLSSGLDGDKGHVSHRSPKPGGREAGARMQAREAGLPAPGKRRFPVSAAGGRSCGPKPEPRGGRGGQTASASRSPQLGRGRSRRFPTTASSPSNVPPARVRGPTSHPERECHACPAGVGQSTAPPRLRGRARGVQDGGGGPGPEAPPRPMLSAGGSSRCTGCGRIADPLPLLTAQTEARDVCRPEQVAWRGAALSNLLRTPSR